MMGINFGRRSPGLPGDLACRTAVGARHFGIVALFGIAALDVRACYSRLRKFA
jgi:hypothetical protein